MKTHLSDRLKRTLPPSLSILIITCLSIIWAPAGTLDPTFGRDGTTVTDFPFTSSTNYTSFGRFVFTQPEGLIVGLGSHVQPGGKGSLGGVARVGLTSSGVVDQAYNGGKNLDWGGLTSTVMLDAEMLADGTVLRLTEYLSLINGQTNLKLKRVSIHGVDDPAFNPDFKLGNIPAPPNPAIIASGVKFSVRTDGKILVMVEDPWYGGYKMIRFNANGSRDETFAPNGVKNLPALDRLSNAVVSDIIAMPNGKIVIGGAFGGTNFSNRHSVFFARLNPDGNMDYSFGRKGFVGRSFGALVSMPGMVVQGDKYLMAGSVENSDIDLMMVRVNSNGRPDLGFGSGGVVTSDFTPTGSDFASAVALDEKGRIVIAGESEQDLASPSNFLVARYTADGVLEASTRTPFSATNDSGARGINIQPDGKILVIGYTRNPNTSINGNVFAFARYTDITDD